MFCFAIFNRLLGCISFVKSVANRLKRKIFLNFCQRNFRVTNLILLLSMLISRNNRSILESNSEKNFFKVLPEKKPTTLLFQFLRVNLSLLYQSNSHEKSLFEQNWISTTCDASKQVFLAKWFFRRFIKDYMKNWPPTMAPPYPGNQSEQTWFFNY